MFALWSQIRDGDDMCERPRQEENVPLELLVAGTFFMRHPISLLEPRTLVRVIPSTDSFSLNLSN